MSLIPASYVALVRTRKNLQQAFFERDWPEVKRQDRALGLCLSEAFEDNARDPRDLVEELEHILKLYGEIVRELPQLADYLKGPQPQQQP